MKKAVIIGDGVTKELIHQYYGMHVLSILILMVKCLQLMSIQKMT